MKKVICVLMSLLVLLPICVLAENESSPVDNAKLTVSGSDKVIVSDFALITEGSRSELIVAFTNIGEETIPQADIQIVFYDENGGIIESETDAHDVFLPGSTVVTQKGIYNESVPGYSSVEVIVDTEKHKNSYINHAENLDIVGNVSDGTVFLQVTNNDTVEIAEIEIVVVFYKDGKIVGASEAETTKLGAGQKAIMEFSGYGNADADDYKIFINQAHTWWE